MSPARNNGFGADPVDRGGIAAIGVVGAEVVVVPDGQERGFVDQGSKSLVAELGAVAVVQVFGVPTAVAGVDVVAKHQEEIGAFVFYP